MLFRPDSIRVPALLVTCFVAVASIGGTLDSSAHAAGCDIPLTGAYEYFPNEGSGSFSGVTVGDWNADGKPDLVTTPYGSDIFPGSAPSPFLHTFLGTPNGLVPGPDVPPAATPIGHNMQVIDLNQDGKLDLIDGGSPPVVWYGHGDGTFDAPIPVPGLPATGVNSIWAVDLNGDHRLDLVSLVQDPNVAYELFDRVRTFLADGSGGFAEGPSLALPEEDYQFFIRAEDLNGDGRGDLVVVVAPQDGPGSAALIYFGDGTGAFQPPMTLHENLIGPPFDRLVDVLDWNGDGKLDIALGESTQLDLYFGHGDGTFSEPVATDAVLPTWSGFPSVTLGDLNGDSIPDLVESVGAAGFGVRLGSPDGHVGAQRFYPNLAISNITLVQAIGGPAPDLVTPANGQLLIYENLAGAFDKVPFTPLPSGSDNVRAADLNGDGRTDFVLHQLRSSGDYFLVEHVTPALTLNPAQEIAMALPPAPAASVPVQDYQVSDITGDGIREILVLRNLDATHGMVSVFLGLPGGTFGARFDRSFERPLGEEPFSMVVGDLNRDGLRDLLIVRIPRREPMSSDQMAGVAFMAGHGDGTVDAPVDLFRTFGMIPRPALQDVNGDGTPDLLAYEYSVPLFTTNDQSFTVRLANGDGTFGPPTVMPVLPASSSAVDLRVGDVDGDGHVDAVILRTVPPSDTDRFRAHVFLGHGDGTFSGPVTSTADSLISSVFFLGDLNADGRADLIVADGALLRLFCGQPDGTFVAGDRVGTPGASALFQTDMDGDGGRDIAALVLNGPTPGIAFHRNRLVSVGEIVASMTLNPPVLQPKSHAPWIHVTLELGTGHDVSEVDVSSLRILGVAPVEKSAQIGDVDSDGFPDLTVAFPREPFNQLAAGEQVVTLTGHLVSGVSIQAQATLRVLETHGRMTARVVSPVGVSPVVLEISQAVERGRTVRIFDVRGRLVRVWNERDALDSHVIWDGRTAKGVDAPSGIYFTRVSTPSGEATARTVLLR